VVFDNCLSFFVGFATILERCFNSLESLPKTLEKPLLTSPKGRDGLDAEIVVIGQNKTCKVLG
jgi:hypothetical protein